MADHLETYLYTHKFRNKTEVSQAIVITFGTESCHIKYKAGNKWHQGWVPTCQITSYQGGKAVPLTVPSSEAQG